jgi:ribosomal protein S10
LKQYLYSPKHNKNFFFKKTKFSYSLISLFPPKHTSNLSLLNFSNSNFSKNKILIKQSYILATWLNYFVKNLNQLTSKKEVDTLSKPAIFVLPLRKKKFTLIKAPMAHKTFSQEQFQFSFYKLTLSFTFPSKIFLFEKPNINQALFLILNLRSTSFYFGTSLFFLKNVKFSLVSSDKTFFKLY